MDQMPGLNLGLGALPLMSRARTRSISAENPTGAKGKGGMAVPGSGKAMSGRFLHRRERWVRGGRCGLMSG